MFKILSFPLAAFCLAAFPLAANAATHDVAVDDNRFTPSSITISVGDTVRWTNAPGGNPHDVTEDGGSFSNPEGTVPSFVYSRTFNSVDEIRYYCTLHGNRGGVGMSGRVSVIAATAVPPEADFTSSCNGLDCNFTDQSTDSDGSIASRLWDFGDDDDATSSMQNPTHSYDTAGTFSVMLTGLLHHYLGDPETGLPVLVYL